MDRRNFAQILNNTKIDLKREYERLYNIFFLQKVYAGWESNTLNEACEKSFINFTFRGTCISLEDFNRSYRFDFIELPKRVLLKDLILLCEYTYNMSHELLSPQNKTIEINIRNLASFCCQHILRLIEKIGYQKLDDNVVIFVPKSQSAIAVAEIIDSDLSYRVIEYNHHSLHGNIEGKKAILLLLANELEHSRNKLKSINKSMEDNLFMLFNNMNLRHDNCRKDSPNYVEYIANMSKEELEDWYDEIYQLCLLAFLEIDNIERKNRIKELKDKIGKGN